MYSHSRINTFKRCPKLYEYQYINNLKPLGDNKNLFLGSIVHKGIELRSSMEVLKYIDEMNIPSSDEMETTIVLGLAIIDAYLEKFNTDGKLTHELHFVVKLDGKYEFQGYIDGLEEVEDGYWLHEYKTAGRVDKNYVDKLLFDDQVNRYIHVVKNGLIEELKLEKPILGIKYRVMKKPQIRLKKNEEIMDFRKRLVEKMSEEGYVEEYILTPSDDDMNDTILDTIQDIKTIESTCRYSKTLSACTTYGRCPYMELCRKEDGAEHLYIEKDRKGSN